MDPIIEIISITIGLTISDTKNHITPIDSNLLRDIKNIDWIKIMKEKNNSIDSKIIENITIKISKTSMRR